MSLNSRIRLFIFNLVLLSKINAAIVCQSVSRTTQLCCKNVLSNYVLIGRLNIPSVQLFKETKISY